MHRPSRGGRRQLTRKVSWWWLLLFHSAGAAEGGLLQRMWKDYLNRQPWRCRWAEEARGPYHVSPRFLQESLPHLFLNFSPCCGETMNITTVSQWLCTALGENWSYQQVNLDLQVPWASQSASLSHDHSFQPHTKRLSVSQAVACGCSRPLP